jgi:nucleoside-diphosphate-sugar epimerase
MRALVTGGAGFIGSHIVDALLERGANVIVLDNLSTGSRSNVPKSVELIIGDVCSQADLRRATKGVDVVFHLAAVSSVQDSLARAAEVHNINLTATLMLLEEARRNLVKRFVFSSSAAVYGDTGERPAHEDMKPLPLSHYAVQKLAGEHYCAAYNKVCGLATVCLRYFNVFGARQRSDSPYSGVIAKFLAAAKSGEPIVIYGDGSQTRDFCPVANVVAANLAASDLPAPQVAGRVFNVGTGKSISVLKLAEKIRTLSCKQFDILHGPAKAGEVRHSKADLTKVKEHIGYSATQDFDGGLKKLLFHVVEVLK